MKDIGIIGSSDGPTSIFVSSDDENFFKSGGIIDEENDSGRNINGDISNDNIENIHEEVLIDTSINDKLNSKSLVENLDSGVKIMGLGMLAVFGVLTILYIVIKIMGQFAKQSKDKENDNEKN